MCIRDRKPESANQKIFSVVMCISVWSDFVNKLKILNSYATFILRDNKNLYQQISLQLACEYSRAIIIVYGQRHNVTANGYT